jgi:PKD repeat protein
MPIANRDQNRIRIIYADAIAAPCVPGSMPSGASISGQEVSFTIEVSIQAGAQPFVQPFVLWWDFGDTPPNPLLSSFVLDQRLIAAAAGKPLPLPIVSPHLYSSIRAGKTPATYTFSIHFVLLTSWLQWLTAGGTGPSPKELWDPVNFDVGPIQCPLTVYAGEDKEGGGAPLTVYFYAFILGGVPPYTCQWQFSPGNLSNPQITRGPTINASFIYNQPGTFNVWLTVTDASGNQLQTPVGTKTVNLAPPLTATLTANPAGATAPTLVSFTGVATGGTPPYTYSWYFGDAYSPPGANTPPQCNQYTGKLNAEPHLYSQAGTYQTNLAVIDSAGDNANAAATVTLASPASTGTSSGTGGSGTSGSGTPPGGQPVPGTGTGMGSGGGPSGSQFAMCQGLQWTTVISFALGTVLVLFGLFCVPGPQATPFEVASGVAFAAGAVALGLWMWMCSPTRCGVLETVWQFTLGAGIVATYFSACCPLAVPLGLGLIVAGAALFVAWIFACNLSTCPAITVLAATIAPLLVILDEIGHLLGGTCVQPLATVIGGALAIACGTGGIVGVAACQGWSGFISSLEQG